MYMLDASVALQYNKLKKALFMLCSFFVCKHVTEKGQAILKEMSTKSYKNSHIVQLECSYRIQIKQKDRDV